MYKRNDLGFRYHHRRTPGMFGMGACPCATPPLGAVNDEGTGKALNAALAVTLGLTIGYFIWGR